MKIAGTKARVMKSAPRDFVSTSVPNNQTAAIRNMPRFSGFTRDSARAARIVVEKKMAKTRPCEEDHWPEPAVAEMLPPIMREEAIDPAVELG